MGHLNPEELKKKLADSESLIDKSSQYFHYKNPDQYYSIDGLCLIEDSEDVGVLYKPLYGDFGDIVWMRPISDFLEVIEVNGNRIPRFQKK